MVRLLLVRDNHTQRHRLNASCPAFCRNAIYQPRAPLWVQSPPRPTSVPQPRPINTRGYRETLAAPPVPETTPQNPVPRPSPYPPPGSPTFQPASTPLTRPHIPLNVTFRSRKSRGVAVPVTVAVTVVVPATGVLGCAVKVTVVPAASVTPLLLKVVRSFDQR